MARLELPVMNTRLRAPADKASSAAYWISGLSTMGNISLGLALVAGRKRVPRPATGKTAARIGLEGAIGISFRVEAADNTRCLRLTGHRTLPSQKARPPVTSGARLLRRASLACCGLVRWLGSRRLALFRLFGPDVGPILLDNFHSDALHLGEFVHIFERPVLLSVVDNRLCTRQADAVQLFRKRASIRSVDVDGVGQRGH